MKKRITIKDIAKELDLSITTVSFVMNGLADEKNISKQTAERIVELVNKLGYQPNAFAKGLRTGQSNMIAFLADNISQPFYAQVAHYLERTASKSGYQIICSSTADDSKKTKELIHSFKERHIDGFIIAPSLNLEMVVADLVREKTPVVLFDSYFPAIACDHVITDNFKSTFDGAMHLIENGCKNIGFITIASKEIQMQHRLNGYQKAMDEKGLNSLALQLNYVTSEQSSIEIATFLTTNKHLDAVFFAANYLCLDGLRAFKANPLLSKNRSLLCFDDFDVLSFCSPTISAIAQSPEKIAESVIKTLLFRLSGKSTKAAPVKTVIPTTFKARESTSRLHFLLQGLKSNSISFHQVLEFIGTHYEHQPTAFKNGEVYNEATQNQGSAKVFAFAQKNELSATDTLFLFAEHYQAVLATPNGADHQNIRQFMETGWDGIVFNGEVLTMKLD